ncbi:hypothetical protein DsansV1_C04g0048351 [Dioscorea sansibarensis]
MEKPSESGVTFSFEEPSDGSAGSDEERPGEVDADDKAELEAVARNADPDEDVVGEEDSQSNEDDDEGLGVFPFLVWFFYVDVQNLVLFFFFWEFATVFVLIGAGLFTWLENSVCFLFFFS